MSLENLIQFLTSKAIEELSPWLQIQLQQSLHVLCSSEAFLYFLWGSNLATIPSMLGSAY